MRGKLLAGVVAVTVVAALGGQAFSDGKKGVEKYMVGDKQSGYVYATPETQAMQDDDFSNPAFLWLEHGEELWTKVDGEAGKSCASCHQDAATSMKTVGATYPKYYAKLKKPINVEQRINICRTENMKAKPFKYESRAMLGMTIYVKNQARDMPMNVSTDGPMKPFYEAGKKFYEQRRGQLDMACANCHVDNAGKRIRANLLSEGMANGFPTYRLKWQKPGSLHRRFRGCNKQVRAKPYKYGADEYVNLEIYLGSRAKGLPVETPAVRN